MGGLKKSQEKKLEWGREDYSDIIAAIFFELSADLEDISGAEGGLGFSGIIMGQVKEDIRFDGEGAIEGDKDSATDGDNDSDSIFLVNEVVEVGFYLFKV